MELHTVTIEYILCQQNLQLIPNNAEWLSAFPMSLGCIFRHTKTESSVTSRHEVNDQHFHIVRRF